LVDEAVHSMISIGNAVGLSDEFFEELTKDAGSKWRTFLGNVVTDATSGGKRLHWISVGFKRDDVAETPSDQLKQHVELPAWVKGLAR